MKRIRIIGLTAVALGCAVFICSCVNIETKRYAAINRSENSIYLEVSGFNSSPLTVEGPFPRWSNRLKVTIKKDREIPKTGKCVLSAGKDFSAQYNQVESGTIAVDRDNKKVDVKVKYVDSYWWNRVKGRFTITEDK